MYGLYHDCARTLKRSLAGKLAIVQLSSGFGFTRSSSRAPCALASFSRARMPRCARTRDVTCELYCRSAKTLSLGTDLRPKGRQVSINMFWSHLMKRRWRSAGWTGRRRKAVLISILVSNVPWSICLMHSIAESTLIYFKEQSALGIPPFTLPSIGWERSTISLHLLGWWFFGMTPNRLMCASGTYELGNGPATCPQAISSVKYFWTVSAQLRFRLADRKGFGCSLKPIRKPSVSPAMNNSTSCRLGWPASILLQLFTFRGIEIAVALSGTLAAAVDPSRWDNQAEIHLL